MQPVIVVAAHKRPHSLQRLLSALDRAEYDCRPHLVISIDPCGNGNVKAVAEAFEWRHGTKEVRAHASPLGLKRHLLSCGDIALEYGAAIILEDDIYVSPMFYRYACEALTFYENDSRICGISLYSPSYNEAAELGFTPLRLDDDVYFMQIPSSWGEAFTAGQWSAFKTWLQSPDAAREIPVPWNVEGWSSLSWKKHLLQYMVLEDLYFVYPYEGFSTNFCDLGSHHLTPSTHLQVPLRLRKQMSFLARENASVIYDVYCELLPECVKKLVPELAGYDLAVDLYGMKWLDRISNKYILTSKKAHHAEKSYSLSIKPHELNIVDGIPGDHFVLCEKESCSAAFSWPSKRTLSYYFNIPLISMDNQYLTWKCDLPEDYFDILQQRADQ